MTGNTGKVLVTGAAGFIGSHLCERLLADGHQVTGIDCFTDYYPRTIKEQNLAKARTSASFRFLEADLNMTDLPSMLSDVDYVFHQAAQAGVRASWGEKFQVYLDCNILATQKLLEAARGSKVVKIIVASSSSVYGDTKDLPMREDSCLMPVSPYGVTKLAAENLCFLYWKNYDLPVVSLRYFTVYGPRQRPDMAFHKFIKAMLAGDEIEVYGDGEQTRDFTFIDDAVAANLLALEKGKAGEVYNIGGGSRISLTKAIELLEKVTGLTANRKYTGVQKGDMRDTGADISKARAELGFSPQDDLETGLAKEFDWLRSLER